MAKEKETIPVITFRANDNVKSIIKKVKKDNHMTTNTAAITYMIEMYDNQNSNSNPYYRGLLAKYSMDMENALNYAAETKDVSKARKVLEELLCQML